MEGGRSDAVLTQRCLTIVVVHHSISVCTCFNARTASVIFGFFHEWCLIISCGKQEVCNVMQIMLIIIFWTLYIS